MKGKSPDPSEMVVAEALRRFADAEIYAALTKLAEATLAPRVCRSQLADGLWALLGRAGGGFVFGALCRFDSGAVHEIADRYGLEPQARRNLSLYVARWAPILERKMQGNMLRACEASAIIDDDGDRDFQIRMEAGDGQEICARVNHEVALDIAGKILACLARSGAPMPKEIDQEFIKRLRIGRPEEGKDGREE